MLPATTDVLIAGGGPCGLVLAVELGRRGIPVVLVDQDAGTILDSEEARGSMPRTWFSSVPTRSLRGAAIRAPGWTPSCASCVGFFLAFRTQPT